MALVREFPLDYWEVSHLAALREIWIKEVVSNTKLTSQIKKTSRNAIQVSYPAMKWMYKNWLPLTMFGKPMWPDMTSHLKQKMNHSLHIFLMFYTFSMVFDKDIKQTILFTWFRQRYRMGPHGSQVHVWSNNKVTHVIQISSLSMTTTTAFNE